MSKSKFINTDKYSTKSQRFDDLLKDGIELVQKFSGNKWTDYNYHDPGITFLEQICYAITDLGYRANFPIDDLLSPNKSDNNLEATNLFIPPKKVFATSPLTINDYKKLIIDSVESVNNVFIEVVKNHKLGINGIFNVSLQLKDNMSSNEVNETISKTKSLIVRNRSLSSDLGIISVLKKDIISIVSDISIDSFVVGEEVLANIYHKIESLLNSKVLFHDYNEIKNSGVLIEDLFSGFVSLNGFIKDTDLVEKTSEIYVSEIKEIIKSIDGVTGLKSFDIFKNGIKIFDEVISFSENSYPSLENIETYFSNKSEGDFSFYRNDHKYDIDYIIFSQIYESLNLKNKTSAKSRLDLQLINKTSSRFTKKELEKYYSIINEFPSIYGLKKDELPSNSTDLRKSQVNQLKSYLLLFDQLMANYLSQLSNISEIFSIDNKEHTFFHQIPKDIPKLIDILKDNDLIKYDEFLLNINESKNIFFKRKNLFIDHLLSRFGESYNVDILKKLYQLENPLSSSDEISRYALDAKINYAKNIYFLGKSRNLAYNYLNQNNESVNISGIEMRLKLFLNHQCKYIQPNLEYFESKNLVLKRKDKWSLKEFLIDDGPTIKLFSLPKTSYNNNQVNFYLNNYSSFKNLMRYAINRKSYLIEYIDNSYFLLFNTPKQNFPAKIYLSNNLKDCQEKINNLIEKFKLLNSQHEGFYMIENLLLRPVEEKSKYLTISFKKNVVFRSSKVLDSISVRDLKNNLFAIVNSKLNFSIVKKDKKFTINIYDVFDNLILNSINSFNSKKECDSLITDFLNYFDSKDKLDENVIINEESRVNNKFPENFKYSNSISFVFPDWPMRYQNNEFRLYIDKCISSYIPAHITYELYYFDVNDIINFSKVYKKWKIAKSKFDFYETENLSLQLIQFLNHN